MRLIRLGPKGAERPGVLLEDGTRVDASSLGEDWDESFFDTGGLTRLRQWLEREAASAPRGDPEERLGSPIGRPSKIICIGLNYLDHARETGAKVPREPVLFCKSTTALSGPDDDLVMPRQATKVDWEVELALVMGHRARYVEATEAMEFVAGLVLHNDYSERSFQLERGGQWVKGKSCDTFAPLGPWLLTLDEAPDFRELEMWLRVNGQLRQQSNTARMIFDLPTLVSYVSQFMTLLPGDVISTGTPAGVGLAHDPPVYLKEGDLVECGIRRLGQSRQRVVRET